MRLYADALRARIYYGWIVLVAVSITEVVSWGILYYAFTVFIAPMEGELGWSRVELTGAYSLALLCSGLSAVPVGRWLDRHGPRALMTAGSVAGTLLLILWSQVTSVWAFYLVMAGIGVTMAAALYEPAFAIVATWFRQRRGRALTVLTFFGAWASFLFIPLSNYLVGALGWRGALLALAAILAIITIPPHALLLRRSPQDLGLEPDGAPAPPPGAAPRPSERGIAVGQALREVGFWLLTFAFGSSLFATVTITVYLIPYLLERGHGADFAATVAGLYGLMSLAGRLLIGPWGDRLGHRTVAAALMAMQVAALAVLAAAPTAAGALVFIALFGAGAGTLTIMRAALLAERYGAAQYGSISGAQNLALTGARTLAPVGAGLLAGLLGGYVPLLWALAALLAVGVGAVALVRE